MRYCKDCLKEIHRRGKSGLCRSCVKLTKNISQETRLNLSIAAKNKSPVSLKTRRLLSERSSLSKHWNWSGGRIKVKGYIYIKDSTHPNKNKQGYVREHRLVVEKALGRYLTKQEVVHHVNHIKSDNRLENLMVFRSNSPHRVFESGGSVASDEIVYCGYKEVVNV